MIDELTTTWDAAVRPGWRIGHALEAHASIGSTNDRVRELLADEEGAGVVVVAEEQIAGRGRRGRSWISPPSANLMASVGVRPRLGAMDAWRLGLGVALALRAACAGVAPVALKWPNDLVGTDGRKLGGILVETLIEAERLEAAVIGFGINVNWSRATMPASLSAGTTSLAELAGREVDRVALLRSSLELLEVELADLEAGRSPLERYRAACDTLGAEVTVETATGILEGRATDLDERGSLVIATARGPIPVASGEVVRVRRAAS